MEHYLVFPHAGFGRLRARDGKRRQLLLLSFFSGPFTIRKFSPAEYIIIEKAQELSRILSGYTLVRSPFSYLRLKHRHGQLLWRWGVQLSNPFAYPAQSTGSWDSDWRGDLLHHSFDGQHQTACEHVFISSMDWTWLRLDFRDVLQESRWRGNAMASNKI
jgi:hypothetical protein